MTYSLRRMVKRMYSSEQVFAAVHEVLEYQCPYQATRLVEAIRDSYRLHAPSDDTARSPEELYPLLTAAITLKELLPDEDIHAMMEEVFQVLRGQR